MGGRRDPSRPWALVALVALCACGGVGDGVVVQGAWIREAPPGQQNLAGYLRIENGGREPLALVRVESPVASVVEMHRMEHAAGRMKMEKVERIDIAAGGRADLEPGGYHLMLIGVEQHLREGEEVELVLHFGDGRRHPVRAPVRRYAPASP